jgi:hypothetical protein
MANPLYSTDLTTLNANETSTGMVEPTATTPESWTNLNALTSAETDFFIQGTACTSATIKVGVGGLMDNNGAGFTIPTDGAVLTWAYFWAPGVLDTEANGGIRTMIGSSQAAFYWVSHGGSDTWTYGGWLCLAMADPSGITVNTVGSPTGTRQYSGWGYKALAVPARGYPFGIDAIRYGRCTIQVTQGGAIGGGSSTYGTFAEIAEFNDKNTTAARTGFTLLDSGYHRLGIFQYQDGAYKWQGQLLLGTSGTAVDFRDSNRSITILDTKHVTANFNLIEVQNASSRVDWTGISITKVGTVAKGRFLATDNADINFESCTFTDMDTFVFKSNSAINNTVFRRCGQVTGGGANFDKCIFDSTTAAAAVVVSDLGLLDNCSFTSDGSSHGVELTTAGSYTWTGTGTGYDSGTTGSPVTPTSTGNEFIYVSATTGTVDISVATGATIPSIKSAGATVNVSAGSVTATLTVTTATDTPISGANTYVAAANGTGPMPYRDSVTIANSSTTATVTHTGHGMATNDKVHIVGASHSQNNGVFTITVTGVNTYTYTMATAPGSNPTGTITSTWVALYGTTDVNGQISLTRTFASDQPVSGWARKSSASPFYKTGPVSGTIDSGTGAALSALLISDE